MNTWRDIGVQVSATLGRPGRLEPGQPVGGGDIHRSFRGRFDGVDLFIKTNTPGAAAMFEAESQGLVSMGENAALRVPRPLCHGNNEEHAWLVMEFVELGRNGDAHALGRGMAELHRLHGPRYGWRHDNFIGSTPQANEWSDSWQDFWWRQRLLYQSNLAVANGCPPALAARVRDLESVFPELFKDYQPAPSLLHGDLWSGNFGYTVTGAPVVYDPACYFGDRETDLAMTELFGGFEAGFYAAYEKAYPLHEGYPRRKKLYQLYHVLNHFNLFGPSWLPRVETLVDELAREER